jgi:PAS domain S-box-containing protein
MAEMRKSRQVENAATRLSRNLQSLSRCGRVLFQARGEQELLQSICQILTETAELPLVWIGYCEDDPEQTVRPMAKAGDGQDRLARVRISWGNTETGQGPVGEAIRTRRFCKVDDIRTERNISHRRNEANALGYHACLALPLIADSGSQGILDLHGALTLYADADDPFEEDEIKLYADLASYLTSTVTRLRSNLANDVTSGVRALRTREDRKRADGEREANLWLLESMDKVNRAIQGTSDLKQMTSDVLDAVLTIFACDRAWLVYPCDPEAPSWRATMEHTRPGFPGAFALGIDLPMDAEVANVFQTARESAGAVQFHSSSEKAVPTQLAERFGIQSLIGMAVHPKVDKPYMFGLHQCSHPRVWTAGEERLFAAVGRRLGDALTGLLILRDLRESEGKLEEAQRIAHVGHWDHDLDTNRFAWSDETYRIFGLRPREENITGVALKELIHPEDRERAVQSRANALRGGLSYDVEYRVVRPNREVRVVHVQGSVTRDESGRPRRIFGTVQDVTDRKRAEAALRERAQLLDLTHDTIFVRNMNDVISFWNRGAEQLYGWNKEEALGQVTRQLLRTIFPLPLEEITSELLGTSRWEGELVHTKRDGTQVTVASRWSLRQDERGRPVGILETNNDITERKRAEYLTGHVFESSPDSICIIGKDYRLQRVNPVFEQFWGKPVAAVVGMHLVDVIGTEFFARNAKPSLDRCFTGEEVSIADWYATPRGRKYRVVTHSPLRPDSQRVEAALLIARDFTDHAQASEALREAQMQLAHVNRVTTMGQLTASIAHEVNQPIAAAVTNADAGLRWLAAQPPNLEEARNAFDLIIKAGNQAGEVTGRIRALVKKLPARKADLDINETILDTIALTRSETQRHSISLQTELANGLPRIWGDRVQLQQVILNLIMNAIEAMSEVSDGTRELLIGSRVDTPDCVIVDIGDSGPGLKADSVGRLFDPFYTTKPAGLGMGLSICRSIIEAHGGRLWAATNVPRGAIFHFAVPSHPGSTS